MEKLTKEKIFTKEYLDNPWPLKGKIKVGARIGIDHCTGKWPNNGRDTEPNPDLVFDIKLIDDRYWECTAFGYGKHEGLGAYGNGSVFVFDLDGVEINNAEKILLYKVPLPQIEMF